MTSEPFKYELTYNRVQSIIWPCLYYVNSAGDLSKEDIDAFLSERLQMKQLSHANVMSLLGVCLDAGPSTYLVMPFTSEGRLLNYLRRRRFELLFSEDADETELHQSSTSNTVGDYDNNTFTLEDYRCHTYIYISLSSADVCYEDSDIHVVADSQGNGVPN